MPGDALGRRATYVIPLLLGSIGCSESIPERHPSFADRVGRLGEELRIDGYAEDLVGIGAIAVGEDGTIAMLPRQDAIVRFFKPTGESIGAFGRRGEGPGEFVFPTRLGWRADTLWVYDNRRLTFITPELELARVVSHLGSAVHALDPQGRALMERGVVEWPQRIVRIGLSDSEEALLLALPSVSVEAASVATEFGQVVLPFANLPITGYAPDGSRVAGAMASVEGPDAGTFALTVVDYEGDTLFSRRYAFEPEPVSSEVSDSVIDARVAPDGVTPPFMRNWAATIRKATRIPPVWPPLVGLLIGNDGSVWIKQREREGLQPHYVVASDGRPVGTVVLSQGSRLGAAMLDRVWIIQADELGVENLVRYALQWE